MEYNYTSALRINSANMDDLVEKLEKYPGSFDEVFFFSQFTHSVKNLDYHRREAEKIKPVLKKVQSMGIKAGINVLCSIGFFNEAVDEKLGNMKKHHSLDGSINAGRLCTLDVDNIEFVKEQYRIYARLSPDMIYIDDDINSISCACDRCIGEFAARNSDLVLESADVEGLNKLFNNSDIAVRRKAREAWMKFNASRIGDIFENIREAVHEVNPEIILGAMTYMSGMDGLDTDSWAKKLSGENTQISWRPGGGVYTDFSMPELVDKANRIAAQIRYLPPYAARVESEMENFPYQSLRKSPSFTAFEAFIYQAAGCTGTAFNVLAKEESIGEEHEKFFKMAQEAVEYGKMLTEVFGRQPLSGAGFWWDKKTAAYPGDEIWRDMPVPSTVDFTQIGIPHACEHENMQVYFLNKNIALQIPDEALKKCLSKGMLLDGEALKIVNERGFGEYTGFKVTDVFRENTCEQETEHPLNMPGEHKRNPRQAFPWGAKEAYVIEKTNEEAEYLSGHFDLDGNLRGMSAGIFENSLGGRVCVEGITPFEFCYSLPRSIRVKNVIRWLSGDTLPVYISSFHRCGVWSRGDAAFVANVSMEDAEGLEIMLKTRADKALVTVTKGSRIVATERVSAVGEDKGYKRFVLPMLPITGTALVKPEF